MVQGVGLKYRITHRQAAGHGADLSEMKMEGDVMKMRAIPGGLDIAAGEKFEGGGYKLRSNQMTRSKVKVAESKAARPSMRFSLLPRSSSRICSIKALRSSVRMKSNS